MAGQKRAALHLSIPGVTEEPQRPYVDHAKRRELNLAVATCMSVGIFQKELSRTGYPDCPARKDYQNTRGEPLVSIEAEECLDFRKDTWAHCLQNQSLSSATERGAHCA